MPFFTFHYNTERKRQTLADGVEAKLGLGEEGRFPLGLLLFVRRDGLYIMHLLIESASIW